MERAATCVDTRRPRVGHRGVRVDQPWRHVGVPWPSDLRGEWSDGRHVARVLCCVLARGPSGGILLDFEVLFCSSSPCTSGFEDSGKGFSFSFFFWCFLFESSLYCAILVLFCDVWISFLSWK